MAPNESVLFSNISATTAAFALRGGRYNVDVIGTGFGTVTLQRLGPDGSTWLPALANFTANGTQLADLASGSYRFAIVTATAVYAAVVRIPIQ